MTQLIIHIGDCKSGSTAIQSVLQAGRFTLDAPEVKFLYPEAGRRGTLNHHRLSNSLFMQAAKHWQDKAWGALAEEIAANKPDVAVVSSERFEFADPNSLATVLAKHFDAHHPEIHIVAYVRPHIERVMSGYVQNVKQGLFRDDVSAFLEQMAKEGRFDYAPRLMRWKSVFEHARVTIRPMIRSELRDQCVVSDFLNLCADHVGATASVTEIPYGNASLSAPALALVRGLWEQVGSPAKSPESQRAAIIGRLSRNLEENDPFQGPSNRLSHADADRARTLYADDARACDIKIFQRAVMVPALNASVEKAPATVPPPDLSAEAQALSALWLDAIQDAPTQKPRQRRKNNATNAQWRNAGPKPIN